MAILKISRQLSTDDGLFVHSFDASSIDGLGREEGSISGEGSEDDLVDCDAEVGCESSMSQDQLFDVPYELYDLPDLRDILSLKTWNCCLTEEERFLLSAHLPSMDQSTFWLTMKQLLGGNDMFFGSPLTVFFRNLKGGLYHEKITRYKGGHQFLQWAAYCHSLRSYHENMIGIFSNMKRLWDPCGSSIGVQERLRIWKLRKSQNLGMNSLDLNSYPEDESNDTELSMFPSSKKTNLLDWKERNPITWSPPVSSEMMIVPTGAKGVLKIKPTSLNGFQASISERGPIEDWDLPQSASKGILELGSQGPVNQQEQSRATKMQSKWSPLIEVPVSTASRFSSLPSSMHRRDAQLYDEFLFPRRKFSGVKTDKTPDQHNHIMMDQKMVECINDTTGPVANFDSCTRNINATDKSLAPITSSLGHSLFGDKSKASPLNSVEECILTSKYYREQKIATPQEQQFVPKLDISFGVSRKFEVIDGEHLKFTPQVDQVKRQKDSNGDASLHKLCGQSELYKGIRDRHVFPKTYKRRKATKDRTLEFVDPVTVGTDLKYAELQDGNDSTGSMRTFNIIIKDWDSNSSN